MSYHFNASTLNPVFLRIGGFEIKYYGLIYFLSFLALWIYLYKLHKKKIYPFDKIDISELLIVLFIGVIVGGRLGHCFIYNAPYYFRYPKEIFMLHHGGMSFFGALFFTLFLGWLYSKKKGIDFLILADYIIIPLPLFLFMGRIANFLNNELYGRITSVPWCVYFTAPGCRHPTQIYEAIESIVIFFILLFVFYRRKSVERSSKKSFRDKFERKSKRKSEKKSKREYPKRFGFRGGYIRDLFMRKGFILYVFLWFYALLRGATAHLRDEPMYYGLTLNHYLCIILFIVASYMIYNLYIQIRREKKKGKDQGKK